MTDQVPWEDKLDRERLVRLLERAVNHYSPSFFEQPVQRVFQEALDNAKIAHWLQPVPSSEGDGRANIVVELGPQPPDVVWLGHVDTIPQIVPDHAKARREGDRLFGLGTSDMKGGCVAAVEALIALKKSGRTLKRGLCLALVVGEEEQGDGAQHLVEEIQAPLCIVGEPTGLVPCLDHHGYLEIQLQCVGRRAHAAVPEAGASAIHGMLEWLTRILEAIDGASDRPVVSPREIRGGGTLFIVAERCEAVLDVHVPPGQSYEPVLVAVDEARKRAEASHPACVFGSEPGPFAAGYAADRSDPRLPHIERAFGMVGRPFVPGSFRSHSDANIYQAAGSLPLVCGPGLLEVAHTRDEFVDLGEVFEAARLYSALFHALCVETAEDRR